MKKLALSLLLLTGLSFNIIAGDGDKIPASTLKKLDGSKVNSNTFSNDGKPMVISFWATWCKPCIAELNAMQDLYPDWKKETGVKIIAISVDDARTMSRVAPFVNGKGWDFESYVDPNGDFKRALNVNMPPQTFVLNGKGDIVWQHAGFEQGNEQELYEVIKKVSADKTIPENK